MAVIPLHRLPEPPAAKPPLPETHVTLDPAARHAMTALKGYVGRLDRMFSGGATTPDMAAQIEALTLEARLELARIARFTR